MNIGEYEIEENDTVRINSIISDFLDVSCMVVGGIAAGAGRSVKAGKQYRLSINNNHYISVKLRYDLKTHHQVELVVHDIRELLELPNYRVKTISGFPMNGDLWRLEDCLLIDWGIQNSRISLNELEPSSFDKDEKEIFFEEIAVNAALSYCMGLWDRDNRNFVWDKTDKKLISIDHESFVLGSFDLTIPAGISHVLTRFFGDKWYDDENLNAKFTNTFSLFWFTMVKKQQEIIKIFEKHDYDLKSVITSRIKKGPNIPLGLIMN